MIPLGFFIVGIIGIFTGVWTWLVILIYYAIDRNTKHYVPSHVVFLLYWSRGDHMEKLMKAWLIITLITFIVFNSARR